MSRKALLERAFVFMAGAVLLYGCGSESKDEVMGQIMMECQLNAHSAMQENSMTDEQRHFALGEQVERCLKQMGLQPITLAQGDSSCFESPNSPEEGKGFIKPLQKCWKNTKGPKS